eukprot:TRINITY_DN2610_c0_g1_i1.p1 TRINITY_DN2610_c0_g1~~TRINITY_DN2610_c0_g1_i1.p1  ORF type:complete len:352 (+),score=55.52 TRINITY_DN2610_c0_g1_i1:55-1056(+)
MKLAVALFLCGLLHAAGVKLAPAASSGNIGEECLVSKQAVPTEASGPTHFALLHPPQGFLFAGGVTNGGLLRATYHPPRKCSKAVPKNTHSIWVGKQLPEKYAQNVADIAKKNPAWTVMIWLDRSPEAKVREYLVRETSHRPAGAVKLMYLDSEKSRFKNWDLIQREQNLAGKSDYLRMEVVYLYGGIYLDTDTKVSHGFDEYGSLFQWPWVTGEVDTGYKNICNCAFGFDQGSEFLKFALEATRENCLKYNNCGVLSGAGPGFLTGALNRYRPEPDILMLHVNYMLHAAGKQVIYQTFDATWLKLLQANKTSGGQALIQCGSLFGNETTDHV